jgi:hypothetical protein
MVDEEPRERERAEVRLVQGFRHHLDELKQ